ncbi:MAG: hypothetical protein NC180_07195 [Muribaculaceae bacterium]|nr:hypothetical protein [Roseburia sp.]MCM1429984.1 hypothetical protein [Muribaculaceae bacterium]MCM1492989.1 hypothetical protein [Muribaculaceae bacterium]
MKQNIRIHKAEPNTGVLDYSHLLDAPAGKHGFVQTKNGHLYFEDGTRARFLGFNVAARSNTPDHETAEKLADRFASMGVNVIRLHAADAPIGEEPCSWSSCEEAPLLDYKSGSSREFHSKGLDRFDYFAAKLKEKGIYLHIDLLVARDFVEGDGLDYPGKMNSCTKCFPMVNERLIELQREYAKKLLCHVNPYTGLALIDDPAVITIQINNEESAIKGTAEHQDTENLKPYRAEVQRKFNHYLLMKYDNRENLKNAWTCEGCCALGEDENPEQNTVRIAEGSFVQPVNDPLGQWDAPCGPARYADYMEFGIEVNRKFYRMMKNYIHSLGAKVPIVTSNLLGGAADVYGHTDGDIMENNSYFNHPLLPVHDNTYLVVGPTEYVSVNPLTIQKGIGAMGTTIPVLAATAVVEGKPFMLSEWNEYGEHPFHSTAYVHTLAYACLNDWDGLILYNHHTSEKWDDQPADEILNVFDVYNDPAVICQWGFMAAVFLKGLVSPSKTKVDIVYTQDDLLTLPNFHMMPNTFLPYVTGMRNVFLDGGEIYRGNADVALNAGFLNGADLSEAKHGVYYAWSPYRDAMRCYKEENRLQKAAGGNKEIQQGVYLGEQSLVFDEITRIAGSGDYREFASLLDRAMKDWGILSGDTGYIDGAMVSDTGELVFDPEHSGFWIHTPYCGYFSGAPEETCVLSDRISVQAKNERITLSLLAVGEGLLQDAKEYVLTAMGNTGMDETTFNPGPDIMGIPFTAVAFRGKLYADTLEGSICVKAEQAVMEVLSPVGVVLAELHGEKTEDGIRFEMTGEIPGIQFRISVQ